jgi:pimeloyl-ACP methyl ester carboxylesterase
MAECSRPVIVLHGLWLPGSETWLLRRRLRAAGFQPRLFHFHTVSAGLDDNAAALARFLAESPGERVDFVGHSLGGVVAVHMMERLEPQRAGRFVCLGSPLNGTRAGGRLARLPGGRRIVGRSVLDLNACGGLAPWPGRRDLGIIAGCVPFGFGRLLGWLPEPHDGTVAVDETRLAGATDHVVVGASHMTLVLSKRVADETVRFLRTGRFTQ